MVTVRTDDVDICWLRTRKVAEYDTMPGEARVAVLLKVPWQNRWQQHSCKDKPEKPPGSACFNSGGVLGCSTRASIRHLWEARWKFGSFQLVILNYIYILFRWSCCAQATMVLFGFCRKCCWRSFQCTACRDPWLLGWNGWNGWSKATLEILCWLSSCVFLWSFEFPEFSRTLPRCRFLPCSPLC